jgi:hypothetical protein
MDSAEKNLPDAIRLYLQTDIPNGCIEEVLETNVGGNRHYLVYVETDEFLYEVEFDAEGHLIKKSTENRFDTEYTYEDFFDD